MTSSSRLIRAGAPASVAVPWLAPDVARPAVAMPPAAEDPAAAVRRGYAEGFAAGEAAGREAGSQACAERSAALERVLDALARPLADLDQRVEAELLALVQAVVRQLVRREVSLDPTHVIGVLRAGLAALPLAAGDVVVRLHPDDAAVVRDCLATDGADRAWRIETDPLLERGGCIIAGTRSTVDARLDTRLGRVIAGLLEDARDDAG
jgi:flagellar assembly protein FliH